MDKDLKKLLKEAEKEGFTVTRTTRGHIKVTREGRFVTMFAGTASDHRGFKNGLAAMRRAGFQKPSEQ